MTDSCIYCDGAFDDANYGSRRTRDHIVPRSFAVLPTMPASGRGNVVDACGRCNGLKANMLPDAIRSTAAEHRKRADLLDRIAARSAELIEQRRLLP